MNRVLKIVFWTLAAALVLSDAAMLQLMYFKPRSLLREHIEEPRANYRLLAINDYRSMRSGDVSWTFSVQRQHELKLVARCKHRANLGAVGAVYKIEAERPTQASRSPTSPSPKEGMNIVSGCSLAGWTDTNRNGGGEVILSGNLVQINIWYD